jgi:hypothetical protein
MGQWWRKEQPIDNLGKQKQDGIMILPLAFITLHIKKTNLCHATIARNSTCFNERQGHEIERNQVVGICVLNFHGCGIARTIWEITKGIKTLIFRSTVNKAS